ncbi:B-cell receptor CD22-like [Oncorhynchus kisutch]|uniref:B-cell receptor CD22-like n=1 Tax=Oncorhynchus kisutch TaxID=8019 RepID=UPI0012DF63B6|nr:B-cell receptor CD22-like [Oncorhynchus kisutch]
MSWSLRDLTTDPGYAGRVEYAGEKERGHSILRITDLREEDSAETTTLTSGTRTDNVCSVTRTKYLILDPVRSEDAGRYSCAVNGQEDLASAAKDSHCQIWPKDHLSVKPSGEIVEGSSVTLTCSSDANPPVDKYTWYKKNVTSPKSSGQSYTITKISSEDRREITVRLILNMDVSTLPLWFVDVQC